MLTWEIYPTQKVQEWIDHLFATNRAYQLPVSLNDTAWTLYELQQIGFAEIPVPIESDDIDWLEFSRLLCGKSETARSRLMRQRSDACDDLIKDLRPHCRRLQLSRRRA